MFLPGTDAPAPKDGGLAALMDDSPQKRLLTQKATPPPSPLLSELLKKGNLITASSCLVRAGLGQNNKSTGTEFNNTTFVFLFVRLPTATRLEISLMGYKQP